MLDKNKTLRIHVLIIDLGTLFVSSLFHYLLSSTNQRRSIRLTNLVRAYPDDVIPFYKCEEQWINGTFYKVCLTAKDEKELLDIGHQAVAIGLKVYYIQENDLFDEPTITCISIGPNYSSIIDPVTKHLKLL